MCHQTVGLVQKVCEENGLICSSISIIDEINEKIKIKRYLSVPYKLGYPLGETNNFIGQKNIVQKLLSCIVS
ncbi:MAG: hypothetical protein CBD13_001225 [Candidatus Pelagibacter sp. TMED153]|nr:MAG: hypothetical protein CBD13_001225 [Candidatus Pelagibacter sp. TMED153]|tara:strand:- start:963 stop:1178 length:216 start_codon:yes stop_codon:yes gene_type:complete